MEKAGMLKSVESDCDKVLIVQKSFFERFCDFESFPCYNPYLGLVLMIKSHIVDSILL